MGSYPLVWGLLFLAIFLMYRCSKRRCFCKVLEQGVLLPNLESRQELTRILELAPLTIVVTNVAGEVEYANPFFTRLTRPRRGDHKGFTLNFYTHTLLSAHESC